MTNHDVVKKLIGKIKPVGETHTDNERFENLKELCHLVNMLVMDIDDVAYSSKGMAEHSIKKMGDYASNFLTKELGIQE